MQVAFVDAGFFIGRRGRHWGPKGSLTKMKRLVAAGRRSKANFFQAQRKAIISDMKYLEFRMRQVGFYVSKNQPVHICWDGVKGRSKRGTLSNSYKSARAIKMGYEAESYSAATHEIHDFREHLQSLQFDTDDLRRNWISYYQEDAEADDLIATKVQEAIANPDLGPEDTIWVFSGDSDLHQLFAWDPRIRIHNFVSEIPRDKITQDLGIPLDSFVLFKSIIGDTSDSITGIPNIGPKKAAEIISNFGKDTLLNPQTNGFKWYEPSSELALESISAILKNWRKEKEYTQTKCVELFGTHWRDLERGKTRILDYQDYETLATEIPALRLNFQVKDYSEIVQTNLKLITLPCPI